MTEPAVRRPLSLSIVIPTKDRPAEILRALASIGTQTRMPDEIIVVDQSARPYSLPGYPPVTHVYDPAINGAAAARNAGAARCRSPLVLFVDDDVELRPQTVERVVAAFEDAPDAIGMQCTGEDPSYRSRTPLFVRKAFERGFFDKRSFWKEGVEYRRWLVGYAMAFRRGLFEHESFDESLERYSLGEDWEFSQRARRYGSLRVVPGSNIVHHVSMTNRESAAAIIRLRWRNFHYFFEKLEAGKNPLNHLWMLLWEIGEALQWVRVGLGLPWVNGRDVRKESA